MKIRKYLTLLLSNKMLVVWMEKISKDRLSRYCHMRMGLIVAREE